MTLTQLFAQVNSTFRGSDDDAPTTGTDYDLWLLTTNRKISEYARDANVTRSSLFSVRTLTPVIAAGVQSYNLDSLILGASDVVRIATLANGVVEYTICEPQERSRYANAAYISGMNPQTLTFAEPIVTGSQLIGGTISLAGYYMPADLTLPANTIPVDDPYWLVYAVAASLAFNDLTYESKYSELNLMANNLYSQMSSNNRRGTSKNPRTAQYNVNKIRDTRTEYGSDA